MAQFCKIPPTINSMSFLASVCLRAVGPSGSAAEFCKILQLAQIDLVFGLLREMSNEY